MSAHTPGPWFAVLKDHGSFTIDDNENPQASCVLCSRFDWEEKADEMHANARLIAAAPELLAACNIGLSYIEAVCANTPNQKKRANYADAASIIRAAIATATGSAK